MAMQQVQRSRENNLRFDENRVEEIILKLADACDIRVMTDDQSLILTAMLTAAGGLFGAFVGGRLGAAMGAGIGGATGISASSVSLREMWSRVKEKLIGLLQMVFNYFRTLGPKDYIEIFQFLMACASSRKELVLRIVTFIAEKLETTVSSEYNKNCLT